MFLSFFYTLRAHKIPIGTHEWLTLMEALSQNLADSSLTHFYHLARHVLVKSEAHYDTFDQAFLLCFKDKSQAIDIKKELLEWLDKTLSGKRPAMPDIPRLTVEELKKKFLERLKEQMEEHHGGSHWIGTGGTSPFGHSGSHPSGIRIGGPGGGRMAVKVAEERRFANYRHDRVLDTRQFAVALKELRHLDRVGEARELSLEKSIRETCKNAGEIELVFEAERKNQTELMLIMDVGGSMDIYSELMDSLFSAAHASRHFKAFHHFYFHNCIYSKLFTDMSRHQSVPVDEVFKKYSKTTKVIFVGDACMNPYELFSPGGIIDYWDDNPTPGIEWLRGLREHYHQAVWLNPEPVSFWRHPTIQSIGKLFPMFPLTVDGLVGAIEQLKSRYEKRI